MTDTTRTVLVAALLVFAAFTGSALASPATTTDAQTVANEAVANETASVSAPDQMTDGESLTIESATLPDGGFVVVSDQSGTVLGHTDYLDAGDHDDLTVSLNETLEDAQVLVLGVYRNNGSETYNASQDTVSYMTANDKEVTDVSYVYFQKRGAGETTEESSEERSTATEESTETDEPAQTTDAESSEETTTSSGDTPGFTPITAVVALLAAALVGWRRV